jgi:hypothetical protein
MNPTNALHDLGQSLWLDNITRNLVNSGTLQRYIDEFSVTGLTSNPTIFDHAIKNSKDNDSDISREAFRAKSTEDLFFELAGRTVFWNPLVAWRSKKATREQTVAEIATRYREFVDQFERASIDLPSELSDRTRSGDYSAKEI